MGLDIGFNVYEKKPLDEKGEYIDAKAEVELKYGYDWVCGRTESTIAWSSMFKFDSDNATVPVFQKALDGKIRGYDSEYSEKYEYVDFEDFKNSVLSVVNSDLEESRDEKQRIANKILKLNSDILELRELQAKLTEGHEFAFNMWREEIDEKKDAIEELHESYENFDVDDYEYSHAVAVKDMLLEMEKLIKEDKYYIIPYFSY